MRSDYMRFAKLETEARFGLASSGVADCAMADLGGDIGALELHGSNSYGYPPLIEAMADRFGVDPACVVMPGGGASFANHLALAALVSPGDEVLIEDAHLRTDPARRCSISMRGCRGSTCGWRKAGRSTPARSPAA